jgi:hypothetical protein
MRRLFLRPACTKFSTRQCAPCAVASPHTAAARWASITCLLCDEEVDSFQDHARTDTHVARFAVCQHLVAPEKHSAMLKQMWDHLRLDFNAVEEVNAEKVARRRKRLSSTLVYLVDRNVLLHSVPMATQSAAEPVTSKSFTKMEFLGELELRRAVTDRCARLFPSCSGMQLRALVDYVTARRQLEVIFDLLSLSDLVKPPAGTTRAVPKEGGENAGEAPAAGKQQARLTAAQRSRMLLAIVGELHARTSAPRAMSVGSREAADGLVDNVLASHGIENIESELIHHVLQKIVEEGTPVWHGFKESLVAMSLSSARPEPPSLASAKQPVAAPPGDVTASPAVVRPASEAFKTTVACNPKLLWTDVTRASALDLTVPNPAAKSAFYAPVVPKLANKTKGTK